MSLAASIVLYKTNPQHLERALNCLLNQSQRLDRIYLVDNFSDQGLPQAYVRHPRIDYIPAGRNLGYGRAHNLALQKSLASKATYHLVMNADVYFENDCVEHIVQFMDKHPQVGNLMPRVFFPCGDEQYLAKLLPSPLDLLVRRFIPVHAVREKINSRYELRFGAKNRIMQVPFLSGSFMFLRVSALRRVGLFDEKFFMYLEDVDLNRRILEHYETVFYPWVQIWHEFGKHSYKNFRLFLEHMRSAFHYFNKWGWLFDAQRRRVNSETVRSLGTGHD